MKPSSGDITVRHNAAASRFETEVDGHLGVVEYAVAEGKISLHRTFVPPELRGRGIAEVLVRAALAHARETHRQVVPACSYVEGFIRRHPEYQSLVA